MGAFSLKLRSFCVAVALLAVLWSIGGTCYGLSNAMSSLKLHALPCAALMLLVWCHDCSAMHASVWAVVSCRWSYSVFAWFGVVGVVL